MGTAEYQALTATKDANLYWQAVVDSGWIDEVPEFEGRRLEKAVREKFEQEGVEPFFGLSVLQFDMECIEDNGDYTQVIGQLASTSFGRFQPSDVKDGIDRENGRAQAAFTLSGKKFALEFSQERDWMNAEQVIDKLVNGALREIGVEPRFQALPVDSQFVDIVFVSERTFQKARDLGVIPDDDFFFA